MKSIPLIALVLLTATRVSAADTSNTLSDTPPPAPPALVMPPPLTATPAATPAPVLALPAPTATPATTPVASVTTTTPTSKPAEAPASKKEHHKSHHHANGTGTSTTPPTHHVPSTDQEHREHHGGMRIIDKHGNARYICGTPIYSSSGAILGSTGSEGCTTNIVASSYPAAIISNGYITYPAGTLYQDAVTGRWQSCPYPLVFDTRTNLATCAPPVVEEPAPATYQPVRAPTAEHSLRSDTNLRSDRNPY